MVNYSEAKPIQQRLDELRKTKVVKLQSVERYLDDILEKTQLIIGERKVIHTINDEIFSLEKMLGMESQNSNWSKPPSFSDYGLRAQQTLNHEVTNVARDCAAQRPYDDRLDVDRDR